MMANGPICSGVTSPMRWLSSPNVNECLCCKQSISYLIRGVTEDFYPELPSLFCAKDQGRGKPSPGSNTSKYAHTGYMAYLDYMYAVASIKRNRARFNKCEG